MKKTKLFLALFCATFIIGGANFASAYTQAISLNGLKADFLGDPHYTNSYTKTTWSTQEVQVTKTTGDREVQLAEFDQNGNGVSPYVWVIFKTGTTKQWTSQAFQIPTSESGFKYKIGAKLQFPWVQTKVETGTWVLDK